MPLYTILAEYAGGTYLAQHRARSPRAAVAEWAQDSDCAGYVVRKRRVAQESLQRDLLDPENHLVPVAGLERVWCTDALVRGRLLLLHIVETDGTPNEPVEGMAAGGIPLQIPSSRARRHRSLRR
jgi:hypothetical protein